MTTTKMKKNQKPEVFAINSIIIFVGFLLYIHFFPGPNQGPDDVRNVMMTFSTEHFCKEKKKTS